jgi:hypothetical protein
VVVGVVDVVVLVVGGGVSVVSDVSMVGIFFT